MGSTFVAIGQQGFWMRDGVLELWLRLLALHVEDPPAAPAVASQIRDGWLLASRGFFSGCVPDGLEEAVATPEGKAVVVRAIRSLMTALAQVEAPIDRRLLNLLGIEGRFDRDLEATALLEVGQAFLDLIEGKIGSDASDTTFMPGS